MDTRHMEEFCSETYTCTSSEMEVYVLRMRNQYRSFNLITWEQ